ncbi:phospholipase D/transphosphatidylase [Bacillus methanolicus PB1]|uniref:Cardiolipin synthase n=1 Tax=Bacillus methanolicus PB1 TaxID=997296 RepID=I3E1A1_BACMT|nr:cardiolipin synthase [Bacillus methanolicus]EIJ80272.1 phospholipase D/transphosphatidylase [Bacillus methanolicus PB1]
MTFIIILILLIIVLWLAIDYTLGRKKHFSQLERRTLPIRESNFQIFTNGPELFHDLFSELKAAKQHIHILFYIVKNDQFSQEFLSILKEKAKAGVEIRLLLDWVGSLKISRKTIRDLKSAGVNFSFSQVPKLPFLFYSSQVRNHRKITVIDGKIGYMGGFNIGNEYINKDPKLNPWRDYHLKMTGEGVHDLQRELLFDWREAAKTDLLHNTAYFPNLSKGRIRHQIFPYEGFFLEETYSALIRKAESSIIIGSPYFIPSQQLFNDLRNALKRGITVTILVPFKSDHLLVKEASYIYFRRLIKEGAEVYEYMKGFYHAKVIIIDDCICDIGTANFDKRSLFLNNEINCYVFDKVFIGEVKAILQKDIQDAKKMELSDLYNIGLWGKIKEMAAKLISHFL